MVRQLYNDMLAHRNEYLKYRLSYLCNWMTVSIKIEVIASSAGSPFFFHLAIAIIASRTGEGASLHIYNYRNRQHFPNYHGNRSDSVGFIICNSVSGNP